MKRIKKPNVYELRYRALVSMGYASYREYLTSDLWIVIRTRVLKRDKYLCRVCKEKAHCVHHTNYDKLTLLGRRNMNLLSICTTCHEHIEFKDGVKLVGNAVQKKLTSLILHHRKLRENTPQKLTKRDEIQGKRK